MTRAHVDFGGAPDDRFGRDDVELLVAFRRHIEPNWQGGLAGVEPSRIVVESEGGLAGLGVFTTSPLSQCIFLATHLRATHYPASEWLGIRISPFIPTFPVVGQLNILVVMKIFFAYVVG